MDPLLMARTYHPGSAAVKRIWACALLSLIGLVSGCGGGSGDSAPSPAATLTSISIAPQNTTVAAGLSSQFSATGIYSDGSKRDISSSVSWSSGTSAVASISSSGDLSTVSAGSTLITATLGDVSGTTTVTVSPATLATMSVTPGTARIAQNTVQQFAATGIYTDGSKHDLTAMVTWSSASASVATISNVTGSAGLASAVTAGSTLISATLNGVSGSTSLTITAATLASLAVTPGNPSIAKGLNASFTAIGTFSDHSTQNLTSLVTWTSANPAIATFTGAAGANGTAETLSLGSVTVTATFADGSGTNVSGTANLTVTAATLMTLGVTPSTPKVPAGVPVQFTATGVYSDDTVQDLTSKVIWSSSAATIATVSNGAIYDGLATTLAAGSTTITATLGNLTGSTLLTVSSVTLVSIGVTSTSPRIAKGTLLQFTATGVYSDHSTQNLTDAATWTSGTPAVATISNAAHSNGLASAQSPGTSVITATFAGVTSHAALLVSAATLVSIAVTPAAPLSIAGGTTLQFKATGTYSDQTTQDLTTAVNWASQFPTIASISNASPGIGLATAVSAGSTTVTATFGSIASNPVSLTVTPATLVSIALTPGVPTTIVVSTTQQFVAIGTYSDRTTQDITNSVIWTSTAPGCVSISNAPSSNGLATGVSTGNSSVSATDPVTGVTSPITLLTVSTNGIVGIQIAAPNPSILGNPNFSQGSTLQFSATGTYADNTTKDITTLVTWTSSMPSVASFSTTSSSNGVLTGLEPGVTSITATLVNITSDPTAEIVTPANLVTIAVTPANMLLADGLTQQYTAIGTYRDGMTFDLTNLVTWSSSDTGVATITSSTTSSNGTGGGVAQAITAQNTTNIIATDPTTGIASSPATLTVTAAVLQTIDVCDNPFLISDGYYTCNSQVNYFAPVSFPVSSSLQFYAEAFFSDGSQHDVTAMVTWLSDNPAVVGFTNAAPSYGLANGRMVGTATVTASLGAIAVDGSYFVGVTPAGLESIAVSPANATRGVGCNQQYSATGIYLNGETFDVTNFVTWTSSNNNIAYINGNDPPGLEPAGYGNGLATCQGQGQTFITATDPDTGITSSPASLTVQ